MGTILLVLQMRKLWLTGMSDTPNISQQSSALMPLLMISPRCPLLRGLAKAWHGGHWRRQEEAGRVEGGGWDHSHPAEMAQPECCWGIRQETWKWALLPMCMPSAPTSPLPPLSLSYFVLHKTNSDSAAIYWGLLWTKPIGIAAIGSAERRSERSANMGDASPIPEEGQSYSDKEEEAGKGQDCGSWWKNPSCPAASPQKGPLCSPCPFLAPRYLPILIPQISHWERRSFGL